MNAHASIEVTDPSAVGVARRTAARIARSAGLGETDCGRAALVATELSTNLVKHAGGGYVLARALGESDGAPGVEILAVDRGRGMASVGAALRDGHSTAGTNGTGLGAVARNAQLFDVYSRRDVGSVFVARLLAAPAIAAPSAAVGAVCVPHPGEEVAGDGWAITVERGRRAVLVIDGLGHGSPAAHAATTGIALFLSLRAEPLEMLRRLHAGLHATRGAAVAVASIDEARSLLSYAGIGNVAATILSDGRSRSLVSHHGTAGHDARRIQDFSYAFPPGSVLVMHSDGVTARWDLARYPGLLDRHPVTIAAVLHRDFARGRDDATVVVVKGAA